MADWLRKKWVCVFAGFWIVFFTPYQICDLPLIVYVIGFGLGITHCSTR